jgi:natural product biosynthesis luciferase-like monooxygenase protein
MNDREPIAIVGMACRFPGDVDEPEALVSLLADKRSAIREVPADRWDVDAFFHPDFQKPGAIHARRLGLLSSVELFDAAFFGISPNEAKRMDPQQRHVLETCYGAIEDAGVPLERIAGTSVAVVIGAGTSDYATLVRGVTERANLGGTSNPGSALSIVSNRVSYLFDLRGPSFTVDTACSSSLTALHYACESIWNGAATAALAGGANSILSPEVTMGFSKGGYLSPDGECRAFSDDANGYVRSEGAAAVFLKPLRAALADRDRIYALIRGTWINQDGRTPGMTVPSITAQEDLLRSALGRAGVAPSNIAYVEAHGTGTPAGDPVEATAIGNVVGRASGRTDTCFIGSVKTNLGHMECCAGMGGLIKLALVLQRRQVLPNINFRKANPQIDFDGLGLRVATETVALPADGSLFGGVNSFGFGGANGHAVLESPPPARRSTSVSPSIAHETLHANRPAAPFVLTARTLTALQASATQLAEHVRSREVDLEELSSALLARRSRFEFRLGCAASTGQDLAMLLEEFAATGEAPAGAVFDRVPEGHIRPVAFVYTGQGPQWFAMGRELLETNATFGTVVDRVGRELARLGWLDGSADALRKELTRAQESSRMTETRIAQPCIFALQVALTELMAERGVVPAVVVGHSIGELAAAVCAGALGLEEAARIVFWRSECQARVENEGAMLAVGLTEAQAHELLGARTDVEIAAFNGPSALTLAGTHEAVAELLETLEARDTFVRRLDVTVPFHCRLMDSIESEFRRNLGTVETREAQIPFYSTVKGDRTVEALDADYWYANIREPVRYQQALTALLRRKITCFLEVGPHPALTHGSVDTMRKAGVRGAWVPTLRRDAEDSTQLARAAAHLATHGVREEHRVAEHVDLPRYPFERERYWLETQSGRQARLKPVTHVHPHIGRIERSVHSPDVFRAELRLDPRVEPYVGDHRAQGHIVFPAAAQLELVMAAARHVYGTDEFLVEDLELRRPIILGADETESTIHRLDVYADDGSFLIVSNSRKPDAPWVEHTKGRIRKSAHPPSGEVDLEALKSRIRSDIALPEFYRACDDVGLQLGPSFRNLSLYRQDGERNEYLCCIEPLGLAEPDVSRFLFHPALLDATFHSLLPVDPDRSSQPLFLPYRVDAARLIGAPPRGRFWSHARVRWATNDEFETEMDLFDDDGRIFARFEGLIARLVRGSGAEQSAATVVFDHAWRRKDREEPGAVPARTLADETWLLFASKRAPAVSRAVERRLAEGGARVVRIFAGEKFSRVEPHVFEIRPSHRDDFAAVLDAIDEPVAGIVHLFALDVPGPAAPSQAAHHGAISAAHIVSTLRGRGVWATDAEAWLVTVGATSARTEDGAVGAAAGTLWGFGRVLMSEQPKLAITLVDLGGACTEDGDALGVEIGRGPSDAEVALRGAQRWVRTLIRRESSVVERPFDVAHTALRQVVRAPGVVDSVAAEAFHLAALGPQDVEVAVRAVGLNFRDVVAAMNLLPPEAWDGGLITGFQLGLDAAGEVLRVGSDVSRVAVGDRVVGFFPHSLATRAITNVRQLAKIVPELSMVEAAALPTPFSTADIALRDLARLEPGETVLIHSAAGGVGTIAVQIALSIGARVIATTSSEEKRAFLRGLGVEHIFGSRSADFGDAIMDLTNGEGVDVVLNSLSGLSMSESFRVLRPFGRFVEIGKTDVYRNRQIGLRQFGENKSWFCLDVNRLYLCPKMDGEERLVRAMQARTSGLVHTFPVRTFPFAESAAALRWLGQGKQIGRVVVEVPEEGELLATPSQEIRLDPSGVHVVTGGCAGFGLALAQWLVDKGARKLVLAGRRGLPTDVEVRKVESLRSRGADVVVLRTDVTVRSNVDELIRAAVALGPLTGVFHAAMVLDDGAIDTLDEERFHRVLAPKADGAWHLHEATKDLGLDHFVLFSSIASVLGTPGQASYAAANAFLDELASMRRSAGLPGTSINWGVIDDVGVVARAPAVQRKKILNQGIRGMSSRRAFELLEHVLQDGRPRAVIADLDPRVMSRLGGAARRFDAALVRKSDDAASGDDESLRDALSSASEGARVGILADAIGRLLSSVVGLEAGRIDHDSSLGRYGLDSLMFAQLQTWIDDQLGLSLGMVRLMRGPSITELATELVAELDTGGGGAQGNGLLTSLASVSEPRLRIVCFPPMAMDAEAFALLAESLPSDVALDVVTLPTFVDDTSDFLMEPIDVQTSRLVEQLAALGPAPLVLYGHSMGAYVALAVARAMALGEATKPALVVVGAVPVPQPSAALANVDVRSPDDVTDEIAEQAVRRFGDPMALSGAQRARVLELARRDLWLTAHGREADPSAPAGLQALLVSGVRDPLRTIDKLPESEQLGYDAVATMPGEHLFLLDDACCRRLLGVIAERVEVDRSPVPPTRLDEPVRLMRKVGRPTRPSGHIPPDVTDLVDLLRFRAESSQGRYTFLDNPKGPGVELTIGELLGRAAGVAERLRETVPPGASVALMHPPGLDYIIAFFGTLMAGRVPVPVYPPDLTALDRTLERLLALLADADVMAVLTTKSVAAMTQSLAKQVPALQTRPVLASDTFPAARDDGRAGPGPRAVAFLQYTSGSTRAPRGVRVTHGNLLANLELMHRSFGVSLGTGVSWLPPYHDMGLVAGNLLPVYAGLHAVLMSPLTFLQRPMCWLETMSRFRANICGAPNFAYDLAARRARPEDVAALDLSSWEVAVCGAEPINPATLRAFCETFAPAGFRPQALYPCYGLAEATLLVTGPRAGQGMKTLRVDKEALLQGHAAVREGAGTSELVSCGGPLPPAGVRILDASGSESRDGVIGEVVVTGPCVADGYHGEQPRDDEVFRADGVRTGDLGFMHRGELYVVGRIKDTLIVRGKKYHPHDLEATVTERVKGVRVGRVLAGGWEESGQPRLVLMAEPQEPLEAAAELMRSIQGIVREAHGITLEVALVGRGTIPKTSSGKLQRSKAITALRQGHVELLAATPVLLSWLEPEEVSVPEEEPEHRTILGTMLEQLSMILEREPDEIDVDAPLGAHDFDSLTAAEMGADVADTFGVKVPMALLFEGLSLSQLAMRIAAARRQGQESLVPAASPPTADDPSPSPRPELPLLSLFFFQSTAVGQTHEGPLYDLVRRAAEIADAAGFEAIWLPERHFHPFGAPFPNPSVLAAALATATSQLKLRAGSVVLPLHHPVRVAEEWAMVDQLSEGRVGLSFTPGWNPHDFALMPGRFGTRREDCRDAIDAVRALWRGEARRFPGGDGEPTEVRTFPRPCQQELPVWLTCTDREERFVEAGRSGFNVLTALLLQDFDALKRRVTAYREARRAAGHRGPGHVTLAVHTHVASTDAEAEQAVREPFRAYLASSVELWKQVSARLETLTGEARENALDYAVERYMRDATLIGSEQTCRKRLRRMSDLGIDEVACQVDFGLEPHTVLEALPRLVSLRDVATQWASALSAE